jgi:hypothetical protein
VRPMLSANARHVAQATILLALLLLFDSASAGATPWVVGLTGTRTGEAQAAAAPPAPTGVVAACISSSGATIKVTWTAVTHASSYTIWQSTTSATSGFSVVATGVTSTSWTSGTLAKTSYWFQVSAFIGSNWTSANSTASAKRTITNSGCN